MDDVRSCYATAATLQADGPVGLAGCADAWDDAGCSVLVCDDDGDPILAEVADDPTYRLTGSVADAQGCCDAAADALGFVISPQGAERVEDAWFDLQRDCLIAQLDPLQLEACTWTALPFDAAPCSSADPAQHAVATCDRP